MIKYKTKKDALCAVQKDGKQLCDVAPQFKDDDDVVEMALKHGGTLSHASIRLQNSPTHLLCEAKYGDGFEINIDKALFCAKRDFSICKKYTEFYKQSDEFQIEMRLRYGSKYTASKKKYNSMSEAELHSALLAFQKDQVNRARNIYAKGRDTEYLQEHEPFYIVAGHSAIQWGAVLLRENGLPFADIVDHYPKQLAIIKKEIDKYCSERLRGSYPERLMNSLLTLLGLDFAREQTFPWSTNVADSFGRTSTKRYDFYIPSLSTIIEVHGAQHYGAGFEGLGGRTLEEERQNDAQKESLAKHNGIQHYIVINALSSTLSFIQDSILANEDFVGLFDLSNINWDDVEAGTVTKEKTDVSFPLYDEMVRRFASWNNAINASLVDSDYIALSSKKEDRKKYISKELRQNIRESFPSERGLYPHELIILSQAHRYSYPFSDQQIPGSWYYNYGIGDVTVFFNKLMDAGYLTLADVRPSVEHSTLPVIKRILSERGFPTKGRKAELVELLLKSIPQEELDLLFPERYLQLTELGRTELEDNAYVLAEDWHGLSVWTLNRLAHAYPDNSIEYLLAEYDRNPRRFLKYLTEDERLMLGITYSEQPPQPTQQTTKAPQTSTVVKINVRTAQKLQNNTTSAQSLSLTNSPKSESSKTLRNVLRTVFSSNRHRK